MTAAQHDGFDFLFDLICTLKVMKHIFFLFLNFEFVIFTSYSLNLSNFRVSLRFFEFVEFPGPLPWIFTQYGGLDGAFNGVTVFLAA